MDKLEYVKSACYFIVILSVLVIAHEWGHYIVAKLCKMRVDDFSLFFGPRLIRLGKWNGTEYNIRSVPLGGFVKIAGMEPEDLSGGSPIFHRVNIDAGIVNWDQYDKTLLGLPETALEKVDFANVSERVIRAVSEAVGEDAQLTSAGKENLQALLLTTSLTGDEHLYLEAILGVAQYKPDPNGYNQKPLWQRAAVIFAGPFMSLFFGYAVFCIMGFTTGLPALDQMEHPKMLNVVDAIDSKMPAAKAGMQLGDKIVEINHQPISNGQQMIDLIHNSMVFDPVKKTMTGVPLQIAVQRNGSTKQFTIVPDVMQDDVEVDGKTVKKPEGHIGFTPQILPPDWVHYKPLNAVVAGSQLIYEEVAQTLQGLFSKHVSENVGGIITIGRVIHEESKEGTKHLLFTGAMLSISLGILNLFPIPILDGGHLMLLSWEGLRRRRLTSREVYGAQMIGLCIIGILFVLVMYNDIRRLLPGH